MDEELLYRLVLEKGQAQQGVDEFRRGAETAAVSLDRASSNTRGMGRSLKDLRGDMRGAAGAAMAVSSATGGMGQTFGQVGGIAQNFAGMFLGAGPVGVGLTAGALAVGALVSKFTEQSRESEEARATAGRFGTAMQDEVTERAEAAAEALEAVQQSVVDLRTELEDWDKTEAQQLRVRAEESVRLAEREHEAARRRAHEATQAIIEERRASASVDKQRLEDLDKIRIAAHGELETQRQAVLAAKEEADLLRDKARLMEEDLEIRRALREADRQWARERAAAERARARAQQAEIDALERIGRQRQWLAGIEAEAMAEGRRRREEEARREAEAAGEALRWGFEEFDRNEQLKRQAAEETARELERLAWESAEEQRRAWEYAAQRAQEQAHLIMQFGGVGISTLEHAVKSAARGQAASLEELAGMAMEASGQALLGIGAEQIARGVGMSIMGLPNGPPLVGWGSVVTAAGIGLGGGGAFLSARGVGDGGGGLGGRGELGAAGGGFREPSPGPGPVSSAGGSAGPTVVHISQNFGVAGPQPDVQGRYLVDLLEDAYSRGLVPGGA